MRHMRGLPAEDSRSPRGGITRDMARSVAVIAVSVVLALVSVLFLSPHFSSTDTYHDMFQKLDEKKSTVLALSAASAATSAVLTAIPDDTCTPIAERMSEISKDFTIVLAAILAEKYLITTLGFACFTLVVPVCCAMFVVAELAVVDAARRRMLRGMASRLLVFGLVLFVATPASVFVTSRIDETYAESIEQTVAAAQQTTESLQTATQEAERKEPENVLEYLQQRFEDLQKAAGQAVDNVAGIVDWVKGILNNFLEAFAVMIVTSFVIPILVPLVIYLAFKVLFGQQQIVVVESDDRALPPAR